MPTPLWALLRQPASFRGLPFIVSDNSSRRGRQIALHVYPFRDDPWPEDLGRSPRVTTIRGFVLGDDCDAQIKALALAVQQPGPGQLVHPSLGSFSAQVLEFTTSDQVEVGRSHSFEMTIVPYVARIYPAVTANTQAQTQGLFGSIGTAISKDFSAVSSTISSAAQAVSGVVSTVQKYAGLATSLVSDATSLVHLPASLVGNFGRFASGGLGVGVASLGGGINTIAQAAGVATSAVANVNKIGAGLSNLASSL